MDSSDQHFEALHPETAASKSSVPAFVLTLVGVLTAAAVLTYQQTKIYPERHAPHIFPNIAKAMHTPAQVAFVHLFEWDWPSIAAECENWLAPKGYDAVQISPPQEHIKGPQWWTRYQPVSYALKSRSGTEAEFRDMVRRCEAVNVRIIVDAVVNHMAWGSGNGTNDSPFSARSYPAVPYTPEDFHHKVGDTSKNCQVTTYYSKHVVQYCDLVGLPDLCTSCSKTRTKIAAYLNKIRSLGQNIGFRFDAAKHQDSSELRLVVDEAGQPWNFQEVIFGLGEAVHPRMYDRNGLVTEFRYQQGVGSMFARPGQLNSLPSVGRGKWGMLPSMNAVTFTDNHDSQRGSAPLTYKNGNVYYLFVAFTLATPYGYPKVLSGFSFENHDEGPPAYPSNRCSSGWLCDHRKPQIANMVAWRTIAADHPMAHVVTDNTGNHLAFARGAAFVAFNRDEHQDWHVSATTGLPIGAYCNVALSDTLAGCPLIQFDTYGLANFTVPPLKTAAFHIGKRKS